MSLPLADVMRTVLDDSSTADFLDQLGEKYGLEL
jgi:hypothetical protein